MGTTTPLFVGGMPDLATIARAVSELQSTGGASLSPHQYSALIASGMSPRRSMLTVGIGASVMYNCGFGNISANLYSPQSFIQWAQAFSLGAMVFPMTVNNTNGTKGVDAYGCWGWSGASILNICTGLQDATTGLFAPIQAAGVIPEVAILATGFENSIVSNVALATMQQQTLALIALIRHTWAGIKIILLTGFPAAKNTLDSSYPDKFSGMNRFIRALDDGYSIFVCDIAPLWASSENPAVPAHFQCVATFNGTTMTIVSTPRPIRLDDGFNATGSYDQSNTFYAIAYSSGGFGGAGTVLSGNIAGTPPQTVNQIWDVWHFTDVNVHPNTSAAMRAGRAIATTIRRIAQTFQRPEICIAPTLDQAMQSTTGTPASATGTNVAAASTRPTTACDQNAFTNSALSCKANEPGWTFTVNNTVQAFRYEGALIWMPDVALAGHNAIEPFVHLKIVSNAANLGVIKILPTVKYGVNGGTTNSTTFAWMDWTVHRQECEYLDGDEMMLFFQPMTAPSGSFTDCRNFLQVQMAAMGTAGTGILPSTFQVIESGVRLYPTGVQSFTPAANGTVTVDASIGGQVNITMPAGNITIAAVTNPGAPLNFTITAAGANSISWDASFHKAADGTMAAGAGSTSFTWNGSYYVQIGGALAFA